MRWVKWVRELKRGCRQRVSKAEQNKVYSSGIELHLRQTYPSYRKAGRICRHMLGSELDTQNLPGAWSRWRLGPRYVRKGCCWENLFCRSKPRAVSSHKRLGNQSNPIAGSGKSWRCRSCLVLGRWMVDDSKSRNGEWGLKGPRVKSYILSRATKQSIQILIIF